MDSFMLALLLVFAIALGGRDQWQVARLADGLSRSAPLLALSVGTAVVSAAVMAWLGAGFANLLPNRAAAMLAAFALGAAAFELAWPVKISPPHEPTRSLGAIGVVLLARQTGDAARFVVFALAAGANYPVTAAIGGGIAGAAAVTLGWSVGGDGLARWPLRPFRLGMAACLMIAAIVIGLNARFAIT